MPDWTSPQEILRDTDIFVKVNHIFAGLFFWEYVVSLNFEWSFLTGKKRFTWPMTFYFLGRYFALTTVIAILVSLDGKNEVDCQALYTFLAFGGVCCIGFASVNLALRAMIVWHMDPRIVVFLVVAVLGHWSLLLQGVVLKANWVPGTGCVATETRNNDQFVAFIYTIALDFTVFLFTAWKYTRPGHRQSRLYKLLFEHGLIYFAVATVANIPSAVLLHLNANPIINILNNTAAFTLSTTAACRAVRHLNNFTGTKPAIYITVDRIDTGDIVCRVPMRDIDPNDSQFSEGGMGAEMNTQHFTGSAAGHHVSKLWSSHHSNDIDLEVGHKLESERHTATQGSLQTPNPHTSQEAG